MMHQELYCRPVKLSSNRVWRTYTGGKLIEALQGKASPADSQLPEDWIASVVTARNPGREQLHEGLSRIVMADGSELRLCDCIAAAPEKWLGAAHVRCFGSNPGVLIKFLDSAERLTVQVHPDKQKARALFHSDYGKTESWYILESRVINGEEPCIFLGFRPGVTREQWKSLFDRQDIAGMLACLNRVPIHTGDTFLVKGGIPHAIGSGCFLLETQEPTDYTIRVERITPKGLHVADSQCHQGLGFDRMFDCFSYPQEVSQEPAQWKLSEQVLAENAAGREAARIRYSDTPCFALNELRVNTEWPISATGAFSVLVVTAGEGELRWSGGAEKIRAGEQLFLPASVASLTAVSTGKTPLRLMRGFPPKAEG